jgi:hypothetical protein
MRLGYSKTLEVDDLYDVIPEDQSNELGLKLQRYVAKFTLHKIMNLRIGIFIF